MRSRDLPPTMRVARLYAWGDVRVETEPTPTPGDGEALIRIAACGVCGSDALDWYVERKAPVVLGHEPAGEVVALGDGVDNLALGDRVFVHHHAPCGRCPACRRRLWSNCPTWRASRLVPGAFAEYACAPAVIVARDTLRLPGDLDFDTATFVEPVACCLRALNRAAPRHDDSVLVVGLGAMGNLLMRLARLAGVRWTAGSDPVPERRSFAQRAGADQSFDPDLDSIAQAVRDATQGRGADVVIVTPGAPAAVRDAVACAGPGARVVCFTPLPPSRQLDLDWSDMYFREITLTHSYSCGPDETRAALDLLATRRLEVDDLVTARGGLETVADALSRAKQPGPHMKSIIRPGD